MKFRFIDTAGIRRKGKTHLMAEKLSVVMARKHLEAADIALLVIDATEGVSALDAAIAGYAHESGRSMIIIVNKWDLITSGQKKAVSQSRTARIQDSKRPDDRAAYEQRLRYALKFLELCSRVFYFSRQRQGHRQNLRHPRESRRRTPQACYHGGDEPFPRSMWTSTERQCRCAASENSLPDPGSSGAADIHSVHRPAGKAALLLPAFLENQIVRRSASKAHLSGSKFARDKKRSVSGVIPKLRSEGTQKRDHTRRMKRHERGEERA